MQIAGYKTTESLHVGTKSVVHRAIRLADGAQVVLKTSASEVPTSRRVAEIRHEYAVGSRCVSPYVPRVVGLLESGTRMWLEFEDIGGISLRQLVERAADFDLERIFDVALKICHGIAAIHAAGVVHKDIKPENVIVHPETWQVQVIDFSIASVLSREVAPAVNMNGLEGTLHYMAPEQTGRMNRGVDHRADFYSLGVLLYELLCGHVPFSSLSSLIEVVHAHIALRPAAPHEVNSRIPIALSAVVMRLLAKDPEERYQSVRGLEEDLLECRRRWRMGGDAAASAFELGRFDRIETFQLPQKLYGREQELAELASSFDRVCGGAAELLLIAGYAGVGKSALVNEIHKGISQRRGLFIAGKFDQRSRSLPYEAVAHAFRALAAQILAEPADVLASWKAALTTALGSIGQVIVDLIPEFGIILGPQAPVVSLPPVEAQNRFTLAFQSFLGVVATEAHPLVLFLDDLQWADAASLKLLETLFSYRTSRHLLVVGAYRDNEVSAAHPLAIVLAALREASATISELRLGPLSLDDVRHLLADATGRLPERVEDLASVVHGKTMGNPFFTGQFLRALCDERILYFDTESTEWCWDAARAAARGATENVVEFMAAKIRRLPSRTRETLELAACIGYEFSLQTLATIRQADPGTVASELWEALREGLVLALDAEYRYLHDLNNPDGGVSPLSIAFDVQYRFLHDRVQQAAYSLIEDGRRKEVHLRIGRLLRTSAETADRDDHLFDYVDQLNMGAELITDPSERDQVARANLAAGRKAKRSTAYAAAASYLRAGMALVADDCFDTDHDLAFALYVERAECEHLSGQFAEAERLFDILSTQAKSGRELLTVQTLRLVLAVTLGKFADAVAAGATGAARYGFVIPATDDERRVALGQELGEIQRLLAGRRAADLLDTPTATDAELRDLMKLVIYVNTAAWFVNPTIFALVAVKQIGLSLRHGHTDMSALGYSFYAMVLASALGRPGEAYEFGLLAQALNKKYQNPEINAKIDVLFAAFLNYWRRPLRSGLDLLRGAYNAGLESGDLVYVSYSCDQMLFIRVGQGDDLPLLRTEIETYLQLMQRTKNHVSIEVQTIMRQMVQNLEGHTRSPLSMADAQFEEDGYADHLLSTGHRFPLSFYFTTKAQLAYLYGHPDIALEMVLSGEKYVGAGGLYFATEQVFFACLILAELIHRTDDPARKSEYEAMLAQRRKRLDAWAVECPVNFLHKKLLVDAEIARAYKDEPTALGTYDRVIEVARENGFPHHVALANELCARMHAERGRRKVARIYMADAYAGYARWGATAKIANLHDRYPDILPSPDHADPVMLTSSSTQTYTQRSSGLDLTSLMKASFAVTGEIIMDRLLTRLVDIMVENAGAEHGALLLQHDGQFFLEAQRKPKSQTTEVCRNTPISEANHVSESIVRLVSRMEAPVVLPDARTDATFSRDPHVMTHQVRSVLCAPVKRSGHLVGIVYLENNLAQGAFTADRLHVLELLATQAAISLENARLYETLEQRVQQRTLELHRSNEELSQTLVRLKSTQRQLVLQEKLASLGAVTAGIAHEIKNPLNFVNNFAGSTLELSNELSQLLDEKRDDLDEDAIDEVLQLVADIKENAKRIEHHGRRADGIVRGMLEHTRGERGEMEAIDVNAIVGQHVELVLAEFRARRGVSIQAEMEYAQDLPRVLASAQDLGRVIVNLVQNAMLALSAKRKKLGDQYQPTLRISSALVDGLVRVHVFDNGVGMPATVKDRIFEPFFTTRPPGEGTGLGLSISHDIVARHGGELRCETEDGAYAEFIVSLPPAATDGQ